MGNETSDGTHSGFFRQAQYLSLDMLRYLDSGGDLHFYATFVCLKNKNNFPLSYLFIDFYFLFVFCSPFFWSILFVNTCFVGVYQAYRLVSYR
jgi:hypothetical protein